MAIAFESFGTSGWITEANPVDVIIVKPSGLAVGDLMLVQLSIPEGTDVSGDEFTAPAGFSLVGYIISATFETSITFYAKLATSADATATDFTFTHDIGGITPRTIRGDMYRISGAGGVASIQITLSSAESSAAATETVGTITPSAANSLIVLGIVADSADGAPATSFSDYQIATSNPSWTEQFDVNADSGRWGIAGATANRAEVSATGTATITVNDGDGPSFRAMAMVVIPPRVDASVSPDTINLVGAIPAQTIAYSGSLAPDSIDVESSVETPTISTKENPWSNQTKNSSSWTNQSKS